MWNLFRRIVLGLEKMPWRQPMMDWYRVTKAWLLPSRLGTYEEWFMLQTPTTITQRSGQARRYQRPHLRPCPCSHLLFSPPCCPHPFASIFPKHILNFWTKHALPYLLSGALFLGSTAKRAVEESLFWVILFRLGNKWWKVAKSAYICGINLTCFKDQEEILGGGH